MTYSNKYQTVESSETSVLFPTIIPSGPIIPQSAAPSATTQQQSADLLNEDTIAVTDQSEQVAEPKVSSIAAATGATVTAFVVGTLLLGFVPGIIVAGLALYGTTRTDKVGDACRSMGSSSCIAYSKCSEAAKKHKVGDKLKSAASVTMTRASEIDQEYRITERTAAAVISGSTRVSNMLSRTNTDNSNAVITPTTATTTPMASVTTTV